MGILTEFVANFKKDLQLRRRARLLKNESERINEKINTPQKDFSFTNDSSLKFDSKTKAIPELTALFERIKKDDKLSFLDLQTYFKYYENGHVLNSPRFKIKREFFEVAIFDLDNISTIYDEDGNITSFRMTIKDVTTGLDVIVNAPASFFTEFTTTPELEKA